jgi:predicted glycoside hydrolase/deacetylase ChbG (UPF0249 family)
VKTLSEQLGFGPDVRVAILHADDVGMCHAQNLGFFEVIEAGIVTSGSAMVPCSWLPEVAAYARHRPGIDLGVHLVLNSEFSGYRWAPVSGAERVPTLVDADGYFWPSTSETLARANPDEVRVELKAQVDRAQASGIDVTHLDAHMGTAMMFELLPIYVELGREYRLPVFLPRPTPELLEEVGHPEIVGELPKILEELDSSRVLMVDHAELRSLSFEAEGVEEHYRRVIGELRVGVTHFLIHPARSDEELEAITPDSWQQRDAERRTFARPEVASWFRDAGVELIGYRRLRDLIRS